MDPVSSSNSIHKKMVVHSPRKAHCSWEILHYSDSDEFMFQLKILCANVKYDYGERSILFEMFGNLNKN
jgi:hypothetical protein